MKYYLEIIKEGLSILDESIESTMDSTEPGDILEVDFSLSKTTCKILMSGTGDQYFPKSNSLQWSNPIFYYENSRLRISNMIKRGVATDITKNITREKKLTELGIK